MFQWESWDIVLQQFCVQIGYRSHGSKFVYTLVLSQNFCVERDLSPYENNVFLLFGNHFVKISEKVMS